MRKRVHSRYDSKTWPLLEYFAARLGVPPETAQLGAVIAMAQEMIERDRRAMEAQHDVSAADAEAVGLPASASEGPIPQEGDNPGGGTDR